MYIDVHCHLDLLKKQALFVSEAGKQGVNIIISNGVNVETNRKTLILTEKYENVKACLGIYPIDSLSMSDSEIDKEIDFIRINKDRIFGIGEVGMDFKDCKGKKVINKQNKVFEKFIKLSKELNKPLTVHSRKAEVECIEILEKLKAKKVIMHYFSGKIKLVDRIVKNNWLLSIPTAVKNSQHFQAVVEKVPIDNLLCETDSPFSHPDKKFPNTSKNVVESYKMIAKIKKFKLKDVEKAVEKNFIKVSKNP